MTESPSVVRSALLTRHGFVHGFSTRLGGVSVAPYDSLQLGRGLGDDAAHVARNHERFAAAAGFEHERLFEVSQVHGRAIREIAAQQLPSDVRAEQADGLLSAVAGAVVGVRTADCLPLLLADPQSGAVAAIHAGWRGVVAGIVVEGVHALCALSACSPGRLVAVVGPHIRLASFEVGEDVAARIARAAPGVEGVIEERDPRPHVDLVRVVRFQLETLGVESIDDVGGDTFAEPERFFSHRRDAARAGRMLSVIQARSSQIKR